MRRFQGVRWSRLKYKTPIRFDAISKLGKSIENQINFIDCEYDDDEDIKIAILDVLPSFYRMLSDMNSTVNSAIKNKEIDLKYDGEKKFSSLIRIGLHHLYEEMKKLETDYLVGTAKATKGSLLKCINFIETMTCMIYDSISQASTLEPENKYRFYYALWTNLAERYVMFIKPMASTGADLKSGSFLDYNEWLEKSDKTGGQSLKELDEIKKSDELLKFIAGGGELSG